MRNRFRILAVIFSLILLAPLLAQAASPGSPDPGGVPAQAPPAPPNIPGADGGQVSTPSRDSASVVPEGRGVTAPAPQGNAASEEGDHSGTLKTVLIVGAVVLAVAAVIWLVGSGSSSSSGGGY